MGVVIIGSGLAGYTVAKEIRRLNKSIEITVITSDEGVSYSKPILSNAFYNKRSLQSLSSNTAEEMSLVHDLKIVVHARVEQVHVGERYVVAAGVRYSYSSLVLALGATPVKAPLLGNAADCVHSVNTLDDYLKLRGAIDLKKDARAKVLLMGAGLIGCELADDFSFGEVDVTVVDPNDAPLSSLVPRRVSDLLRDKLTDKGVNFLLGTTVISVNRRGSGYSVLLSDGRAIQADVIISAIGLRPNIEIAKLAGIKTSRGILVDASGRTSDASVFALGDCAQYLLGQGGAYKVLPYIAPILNVAKRIASCIAGDCAENEQDLKSSVVIVKTPSLPIAVLPLDKEMHANGGEWQVRGDESRIICQYVDESGEMRGFAVTNHDAAIRNSLLSACKY